MTKDQCDLAGAQHALDCQCGYRREPLPSKQRLDQRLRNKVGGFLLEPDSRDGGDTLAIALCSYFERHIARPLDDTESENGWSAWAEAKTNAALDALTKALMPPDETSAPTGYTADLVRALENLAFRYRLNQNVAGTLRQAADEIKRLSAVEPRETPVPTNLGWLPWHPQKGYDTVTELVTREEELTALVQGWRWVPIYGGGLPEEPRETVCEPVWMLERRHPGGDWTLYYAVYPSRLAAEAAINNARPPDIEWRVVEYVRKHSSEEPSAVKCGHGNDRITCGQCKEEDPDMHHVKAADLRGGDPECYGAPDADRSEEEFRARVGLPPVKTTAECPSVKAMRGDYDGVSDDVSPEGHPCSRCGEPLVRVRGMSANGGFLVLCPKCDQ